MRQLKLDEMDLRTLINGLYQMRQKYSGDVRYQVDALLFSLIQICEGIRPGKKQRIPFQNNEVIVMRRCLIDWRNQKIDVGDKVAVDVINEYLMKFAA